jgi:hypothetical protein
MQYQIFKNNNTGEKVHIVQTLNDTHILSNGNSIKEHAFFSNFTPVTGEFVDTGQKTKESVNNSINPADVLKKLENSKKEMNQLLEKLNLNQNQPSPNQPSQNQPKTMSNPNPSNEVVDPTDFLYGNTTNLSNLASQVQNIDPNQVNEIESLQNQTIVNVNDPNQVNESDEDLELKRKKEQMIKEYNRVAQASGEPTIKPVSRLNDEDLSKFQQVDEDDESSVKQFLNTTHQPKTTEPKDPETGLTPRQQKIREQTIQATGEDPFLQKVQEWQAKMKTNIKIPPRQTSTVETSDSENSDNSSSIISNNSSNISGMELVLDSFNENHKIDIKIESDQKIVAPSILKMLAPNVKGDIAEYYADKILTALLSDIAQLKEGIYGQIYYEIYGKMPPPPEIIKEEKEEIKKEVEKEELIPGKPTKSGKITFKYLNDKGQVKDYLPTTAKKKGYQPATKKDL